MGGNNNVVARHSRYLWRNDIRMAVDKWTKDVSLAVVAVFIWLLLTFASSPITISSSTQSADTKCVCVGVCVIGSKEGTWSLLRWCPLLFIPVVCVCVRVCVRERERERERERARARVSLYVCLSPPTTVYAHTHSS
jgi:hypothetical protein